MGAEPEVRVETKTVTKRLVGTAEEVTLYVARAKKVCMYEPVFGILATAGGGIRGTYLTCAQAHAAHPDASVESIKAMRVGGGYYRAPSGFIEVGEELKVTKPKRAKGAK
jgi:predicted glycosyltransferase